MFTTFTSAEYVGGGWPGAAGAAPWAGGACWLGAAAAGAAPGALGGCWPRSQWAAGSRVKAESRLRLDRFISSLSSLNTDAPARPPVTPGPLKKILEPSENRLPSRETAKDDSAQPM